MTFTDYKNQTSPMYMPYVTLRLDEVKIFQINKDMYRVLIEWSGKILEYILLPKKSTCLRTINKDTGKIDAFSCFHLDLDLQIAV